MSYFRELNGHAKSVLDPTPIRAERHHDLEFSNMAHGIMERKKTGIAPAGGTAGEMLKGKV